MKHLIFRIINSFIRIIKKHRSSKLQAGAQKNSIPLKDKNHKLNFLEKFSCFPNS